MSDYAWMEMIQNRFCGEKQLSNKDVKASQGTGQVESEQMYKINKSEEKISLICNIPVFFPSQQAKISQQM